MEESKRQTIKCDVKTCKHNNIQNCLCDLDCICVSCNCDKDSCTCKKETICNSFTQR